ncbi:MAG: hypothetical protein IJ617_06905 [Oscillospiraceae bacterium]|nr:hypothetical protein [Oscillospiraceae bacterium]
MKRALVPALMISLLLCACGGEEAEQQIERQRDALAAAEEISFTARVRADLGDEVFLCVLDCEATAEGLTVEVVEPEEIAGIRARALDGNTELEYEGVVLGLGGEAGGPLGAVPLLLRALTEGHVIRAWEEDGGALVAAEIYADDDCALTLWFDGESLAPRCASVSEEDAEFLRCDFEEFRYS